MMIMIKRTCIWVILIGFSNLLSAQETSLGEEHFKALVYLNNESIVQEKLVQTFQYLQRRKRHPILYTIGPTTEFLPIYFFHYQLTDDDISISAEFLDNRDLYREEYPAALVEQQIIVPSESTRSTKVSLTFSPLIKNYLIAEFLDSDANIGAIKTGRALQVLFIFDQDRNIAKVLFASPIYN